MLFSLLQIGLLSSAIRRLRPVLARIREARRRLGEQITRRVKRKTRQRVSGLLGRVRQGLAPVERVVRIGITGVTTVLLGALLLQPTLVPLRFGPSTWVTRAANLVDGTASVYLADSVVGLQRVVWEPPPVQPEGLVDPDAFGIDLDAEAIPLMDRWDPLLIEAAGGDRDLYAQTKAFLWVESGGRQYALSATGCAGLMQFCASTARRKPFKSIFGVGAVSACGCRDCGVPASVRVALETDPSAVETHRDRFPCDLSDARFDARRSIEAGTAFVQELSDQVGGNLLLMYIGYNSGPRIAKSLYRTLGEPRDVTIDDLRPHLAAALRPHYGSRSTARANGLLDAHLPKLQAAYQRWR